jgi:hypothetical protein
MYKLLKITIVALLVSTLASCGSTNTTSGLIKVVSKEHTEKNSYWIKVEDLGKHPEEVQLKVTNKNTWNLILEGQIYNVMYDFKTKDENTGKLVFINPADSGR